MIIGVPIINGVSYTHADIVLNLFGVPIIGVTGIDYGSAQEINPNYSTGQKPTSVGFGPVNFTATLTLTLEAIQAIQAVAPLGAIQNIGFFDVGVNYLPDSGFLVRHALRKCRFKGRQISSQVGNTQIEEKLELFVADIDFNAA